ncbi:MAG: response regulator [Parvularculaceae bacterium]|nr:response regulator [Parvularculaceae bacterium]
MKTPAHTLRSRLTMLVIIAIFGSVGIVTASSVMREIGQYDAGEAAQLQASADVFAMAIARDVRENDRMEALGALRAISRWRTVKHLRVELADRSTFIELGSQVALTSKATVVKAPIIDNGRTLGWLHLHAASASLAERISVLVWDAFVAALFAAGIGLIIALRMQRDVTLPILELSAVMKDVRETGDFSKRALKQSEDEIGSLVESFNVMLGQIQERDRRLLAHQTNLKNIVRQRTQQLEKAKEIAERANKAKTEFLATMSHEIRTPMNGMLVMAELLSKSELPPRHKRYADVIVKSGQGLLAIINDILDFSKIEAGKLELERIPVSPVDVINEVVGLFWERASSKSIDLSAYVGPNVPEKIEGDPVRLNQILSNLLNNALKFTATGDVVVAARRVRSPEGTCYVEFSVTDTGVGIPKEKQATIFEAFSQADQSTTRKFGGTGLGLAICQRLVEAMGGAIGVQSEEGKGSRFYFAFPTRIIEPARPPLESTGDKRAIIAVAGSATPKVLSRYLEEAGISSQIVNRESAVVSHTAYADIIFAAPEFLDAFHAATKGAPAQWVPARICVSELGDAAPDRLLAAGMAEDLLIKPLSRYDVMDQIERILKNELRGVDAVTNAAAPSSEFPSFSGARVLAADDSAVNREVVREALSRLDIDATVVEDGRAAVEAALAGSFDLILMDCSMPGMDGYEATRAIRAFERDNRRRAVPIIALTAHVQGEVERWRAAGMNEYLTKPFTIAALSAAIGSFLPEKRQPARIAAPRSPASRGALPGPDAAPNSGSPPTAKSEVALSQKSAPGAAASPPPDRDNDEDFGLRQQQLSPPAATAPGGSAATTPPLPASFDEATLIALAQMGSPSSDIVGRALKLYEEHSKPAAQRLAKAMRSGDLREIKSAAHALKGMSYNVGAKKLGEVCAQIEAAASAGGGNFAIQAQWLRIALTETLRDLPAVYKRYRKTAA